VLASDVLGKARNCKNSEKTKFGLKNFYFKVSYGFYLSKYYSGVDV